MRCKICKEECNPVFMSLCEKCYENQLNIIKRNHLFGAGNAED